MIELDDNFQGHIILYCKGQYDIPDEERGFFNGLKMIWAIRCGYDHELTDRCTLTHIANDMYKIISKCIPDRLPYIMETLHREINSYVTSCKPKDPSPIEAIIWEYRSMLNNLQIKEKDITGEYIDLVKLPEAMPEIFNRILSGKGEYDDYYLISPKKR